MRVPITYLLAAVLSLAPAVPTFAQTPPDVTAPDIIVVPPLEASAWKELKGKAGYPVLLSAGTKNVSWILIDEAGATLQPINPDKNGKSTTANFGSPNGGRFRMLAVLDGAAPARIAVTLDGPVPDPFPKPPTPPTPPNPPAPSGTAARFTIVEDTLKAGLWRGDLFGSPKIRTFYTQMAHGSPNPIHRVIDINDVVSTDPTVKAYQAKAAGKALPWLFVQDAAGKDLKDLACPQVDDAFIAAFDLHTTTARKMGLIVAPPKLKWTAFGSTPATPIIDRTQWKNLNMGAFCPPVHDQDGRGQCASSAACALLEFARAQAGLPFVKLSAGDLYSRVNGGSDNGSLLEDNLAELLANGVCSAATVPYVWDGKKHNTAAVIEERKRFRFSEVYQCKSFDAMASAALLGMGVEHGMMWRDGFRVDANGWLYNATGGEGGHAQFAYGLAQNKTSGKWGLVTQNSWNVTWGGSQDGTVKAGSEIVPEDLFGNQIGGYFAVRAAAASSLDFPVSRSFKRVKTDNPFEFALAH